MEKQLLSMAWKVGTRRKNEFSLVDSYGFVWECVLHCLGGFYGLVAWYGEIALMSHEARKTAIQSWVVPKLRKKLY